MTCAVRDAGVGCVGAVGSIRSARMVMSQVALPFPWRRWSRPLGALFGTKRAARGRVDGLVAVIPTDAIARRGIGTQDFLNDTRTGSAIH